jgi:hypothetical protein
MKTRLPFALVMALGGVGSAAAQAPPAPSASPTSTAGEVVLEMIVEAAKGQPITDLKRSEVVLTQDDVRQEPTLFEYRADKGWYEVRYVPSTGKVGAIAVGVNRSGAKLRGVEGPALKPRFVAAVAPFEVPLRAALDAEDAPAAVPFEVGVLRFETRDDTLHHTLVAEVPVRGLKTEPISDGARAHLAFFLRVRAEDGRVVHEGSLDQPVELGPMAGDADPRHLVWTGHVHLRPGRYRASVVVMDRLAARVGVRHQDVVVEPWPSGLRVGDLTFLLGVGELLGTADADNPLTGSGSELIPTLRPRWLAGSEGLVPVLMVVFPDHASAAPLTAALELRRSGALVGRVPVQLPPARPGVAIRQVATLGLGRMELGSYVVKLIVEQGGAKAETEGAIAVEPTPKMPWPPPAVR